MARKYSASSSVCIWGDSDPGVNEDLYGSDVGCLFYNTVNKKNFICSDATSGAQIWLPVNSPIQTFAPYIRGSTSPGIGTYTIQQGYYTRNGYNVFSKGTISWTTHTGNGNLVIDGFPLTFANLANANPVGECILENIAFPGSFDSISIIGSANTITATIQLVKSNASATTVGMSATGTIHFTMTYLT